MKLANVDGIVNHESDPTALAEEAAATTGVKHRKPRATDGGPEILPDMGHVRLLVFSDSSDVGKGTAYSVPKALQFVLSV